MHHKIFSGLVRPALRRVPYRSLQHRHLPGQNEGESNKHIPGKDLQIKSFWLEIASPKCLKIHKSFKFVALHIEFKRERINSVAF